MLGSHWERHNPCHKMSLATKYDEHAAILTKHGTCSVLNGASEVIHLDMSPGNQLI